MVPIVIRNAIDVAPKGDIVYRRGTVEVEVLPPVDTSSWSADTIEDHVAEVRGMFLDVLGQEDRAAPAATSLDEHRRSGRAKKSGANTG